MAVDPSGMSGAETSGDTGGDAATAEATEQILAGAEGGMDAGGPAEGPEGLADAQSDDAEATTDSEPGEEATAEAAALAEAEDRQDLEQYPESVRDRFKSLKPAERRALYEHAETNARAQIEAANKRAAELQQAEDARQAQIQAVLDSQGKFVGTKPIDLTQADGTIVPGPTYDELSTALRSRRGRDQLWEKYGLQEDTAEAVLQELDNRREMLDGSVKLMDDAAWGKLALRFKAGLEAIPEIDADAMVAGAAGPEEVIARLSAAKDEKHAREMAAVKRDYEGRIGTTNVNAEALRGRVVAAESRKLPTGGRTGGGSVLSEIDRLQQENPEEYIERAKRGDFAGADRTR